MRHPTKLRERRVFDPAFEDFVRENALPLMRVCLCTTLTDVQAVALDGFDIAVDAACPLPSDPQRLVALLLEGRALFTTPSRLAVYRYDWEVEEVGLHNVRLTERPWERFAEQVHADTLVFPADDPMLELGIRGDADSGFVRPAFPGAEEVWGYQFLVPTAQEVFTDAFAKSHCFDLIAEPMSRRVGLVFSVRVGAELEYDVEGTLWLPLESDVRPELHFGFTRFPQTPDGRPVENQIVLSQHLSQSSCSRESKTP